MKYKVKDKFTNHKKNIRKKRERFSNQACSTIQKKGYFYNFKKINEPDWKLGCQDGRTWTEDSFNKPKMNSKGVSYISAENSQQKGLYKEACASSAGNYEKAYDETETSVLSPFTHDPNSVKDLPSNLEFKTDGYQEKAFDTQI